MKIMRVVRNMNAISIFMRNAGCKKHTITIVNRCVVGMIILLMIITGVSING